MVLLVSQTAHNRRVLGEWRESARAELPLDGAAVLRALAAGSLPPTGGVLVM